MRFKVICAYDGTDFVGWQSQPNGKSVQDTIERRLETIFKKPVRIHASGRTDSGVHARGQVFHFDADWKHTDAELLRAFGSNIPETILIGKIKRVSTNFHARFSANGKRYIYNIHQACADPMETRYSWSLARKLNTDAMRQTAERLCGRHDFRAYSTRRNDGSDETLNPVKTLKRLDIRERGPRINIIAEADGFLYKMVRSLVGALVDVGLGKLTADQITDILESGERGNFIQSAPARGLSLEKVFYQHNTRAGNNAATLSLHQLPDGREHIDIFLGTNRRSLITYEAEAQAWEEIQNGKTATVTQKADHRLLYLSHEGNVSKNRGSLKILWQGSWHSQSPSLAAKAKMELRDGRIQIF